VADLSAADGAATLTAFTADALEAQAFAYLALRALDGLPLSLPGTTGVAHPVTGGVRHRA
jgi:anhydro-N-acetylmuramic acid kinase